MASLALGTKFIPNAGGTGDFVYQSVVTGYVSPTTSLVDGKSYRYRAENLTLTEWEFGTGVWSSTTDTLTRAAVVASSTGTKVAFSSAPQIGIVIFPEDVLSFDDSMSLTAPQQSKAIDNLGGTTIGKSLFSAADTNAALAALGSDLPWYAMAPGGIYYANTSIVGVAIPPQSHPDLVFVQLTAGLTGSGQYNEGKLTSESVSGSAPLVVATAVVDVVGSPLYGQTIPLLNTEESIQRPRATGIGSLQQDQMQQITGSFRNRNAIVVSAGGAFSRSQAAPYSVADGPNSSDYLGASFNSAWSTGSRVGAETRGKNRAVTAFQKVK